MPFLKILILARIPLIREGLRALLADERDFRVSALAPSDDWFEELVADKPAVLLIDVQVLEQEGWEVLDELCRALPMLTTLVLGDSAQDSRVPQALALGARGYLLRDESGQAIAAAIRAAQRGTIVLHPQLAANVLRMFQRAQDDARETISKADGNLIEPLSARELDVLRLIARGLANKQIAAELVISEHTVKFHIRAILGKLGAANRTEAVTLALHKGLVNL